MRQRLFALVVWGLASAAWAEGTPLDECPKFERLQVPAADLPSAERANTQPTLSATEEALKQADAELNTVYKAKLAEGDETARQLLKAAQRAWIPYRDAWVRFQQARWSAGVDGKKLSTEVLTRLTRERTAALKELRPTSAE